MFAANDEIGEVKIPISIFEGRWNSSPESTSEHLALLTLNTLLILDMSWRTNVLLRLNNVTKFTNISESKVHEEFK